MLFIYVINISYITRVLILWYSGYEFTYSIEVIWKSQDYDVKMHMLSEFSYKLSSSDIVKMNSPISLPYFVGL